MIYYDKISIGEVGMFDKFVPDKYFKSIYDINYEALKKSGITCLIFDQKNTLEPESVKKPSVRVKDLFEDLKAMGFKLLIVSNARKKDVEPFKESLCVDSAYFACKPLKRKFKKILNIYELRQDQVAVIGDEMLFDILGANRMGLTSILVNPISLDEFVATKLGRKMENRIIRRLTKKELFKKGRYYE